MKKIYVSYFFRDNEEYGISNIIVETKDIKKIDDVATIESAIAANRNLDVVKLISWQQMK